MAETATGDGSLLFVKIKQRTIVTVRGWGAQYRTAVPGAEWHAASGLATLSVGQ
jgi:hypothetical protein